MALVEITGPATAENAVIHLHDSDNVAIARVAVHAGDRVRAAGGQIVVRDDAPAGHKVAVKPIGAGEMIVRYGQAIGRTSRPVLPGEHVHTHNVDFEELAFVYEYPEADRAIPDPPGDAPVFRGYPRADGRAGTRNYIAVMAASNCAAHTAELIAEYYSGRSLPANIHGVRAFPHGEGCGHAIGPDTVQLRRTLAGILDHPNVAGALLLGLGCEVNQIDQYLGERAATSGRLIGFTLQQSGGTRGTVEAACREIDRMIEAAGAMERQDTPVTKLVLGLNCGGSDSFSGITANPALGYCSDRLCAMGGAAVLAETPEIVGAEHLLVRRARNREVAEKLLGSIAWYKEYLNRFGGSFDDNPSPGNKRGGLTNILEKSLGAIAKGGTSTLNDVVEYGGRIEARGLVFMNTPGYDPVSLTGLAAGGVNVIAFTTGRGSAIGFPTIPVLKIASNSATYRDMRDNMDVNAGAIADGNRTVGETGEEILQAVLRVASGELTAAERLGHAEFVPWRIGPVL